MKAQEPNVLEARMPQQHSVPTAKTRRQLSGDLDNIVLKALRKEPERRYASVEQFAEDIRRHLGGLPVSATPDSLFYRANKFVRRHKLGVLATALIVIALLGGIAATLREARIAAANQRRAERRFNDVRKLANSLMFEIHDSIEDLPGATPARKLLVSHALEYLDSLTQESGNDPSLERELATAYERVGDVQGYPFRSNLGDTSGAIRSYQKALAIRELLAHANPNDIADELKLAVVCRRLAETHSVNQNITAGVTESLRAVQIGETLASAHPQDIGVLEELLRDYETLAGLEGGNFNAANLGDTAAALVLYQKAATIAQQLVGEKPNDRFILRLQASAVLRLGDQLVLSGERHEALKQYLIGQKILEAIATSQNATSQGDLAEVYARIGNMQLADGDARDSVTSYGKDLNIYKLLAQADPQSMNTRLGLELAYANFGDAESRNGNRTNGMTALQTAQKISDDAAVTSPTAEFRNDQGIIRVMLAEALARSGNYKQALRFYQEALSIYSRLNSDDSDNIDSRLCLAATYNKVGSTQVQLGNFQKATDAFRTGLKLAEPLAISKNMNAQAFYVVANAYSGLGDTMVSSRDWQAALNFYEQSLKVWDSVKDPGIISPEGFESVPPATVATRLELCKQELRHLKN